MANEGNPPVDPPSEGGAVVIRMKKADHARFVELLPDTSAEFFDAKEASDFRAIVKTYFSKGA